MDFASLTPLPGGWSGQTFLGEAGGEQVVVRIYPPDGERGVEAATVDAALLRLVRGLVPVPAVREVRRPQGELPALLVTEFVPGSRAELVLPALEDAAAARLGERLAGVLATLSAVPFLRAGQFLDGDLAIGSFGAADDLPEWIQDHAQALAFDASTLEALMDIAASAQDLLDTIDRVCLVHSDFNLKNLLVDPDTLEVTAVLDWEFAHAGHPFTDLGNLLRFERRPAFAEAVLASYGDQVGLPPARALELARAADLWALTDLAARRAANPVAARAHEHLLTIARTGDLSAWPGVTQA